MAQMAKRMRGTSSPFVLLLFLAFADEGSCLYQHVKAQASATTTTQVLSMAPWGQLVLSMLLCEYVADVQPVMGRAGDVLPYPRGCAVGGKHVSLMAPWSMQLRGGGKVATSKRRQTAGNAWEALGDDDDEVGGKRRLTSAQLQSRLKRARQKQKEREAIDLDDPRFNQQNGRFLDQQLGNEISSEEIPDPDAPIDLSAMPHMPWEQPHDADAPNSRRPDGSKTSWERPRGALSDSGADDADNIFHRDDDEPYHKRTLPAREDASDKMTGNLLADAEVLEQVLSLLALLVHKYMLYWYKSTNTDAGAARHRGRAMELVKRLARAPHPHVNSQRVAAVLARAG